MKTRRWMLLLACLLLPLGATGVAQEWSAALERLHLDAQERALLQEAYASRAGPLWFHQGTPTSQALALAAALSRADEQGLAPEDYGGPGFAARLAQAGQLDPQEQATLDVALSTAALLFIGDLGRGRIDPRAVRWQLGGERPEPPDAQRLLALADAPELPAFLDRLETPFPIYRRTAAALRAYRALAARGEGPPIPDWKRPIVEGDAPPGLDALAARLALLGDLPSGAAPPQRYQGALVDAVKAFQLRHGLRADGRIERTTLRALAIPLRVRVRQLELALERMRWLPRDLAPPLLVVNIPEFRLRALPRTGAQLEMNVVVGRAYHHRTPVFLGMVEAVLFHPYWDVPNDIAVRELLPEFAARPASAEGFEVVDAQGVAHASPFDEAQLEGLRTRALRLRQRPGPRNSLGPIKLVMPNPFEVYLHGTPALKRFAQARRDFSHGCIRVEEPAQLAAWSLAETPGWNEARIAAVLAAGESVRADLAHPIPVLILYTTTVVYEDQRVFFFEDVYGNDKLLDRKLKQLSESRRGRFELAPVLR